MLRNFLQGNWGNQGNFELLVPQGDVINHYFRNNDDVQFPWQVVHQLSYHLRPAAI
jgi:hypothetical protein